MPTTVWFETHSTTMDNERGIATGWLPGELSAVGRQQASALGERLATRKPVAVYCSDLARAVQTATIAFARLDPAPPLLLDWRLRECDYGALNGAPHATVHGDRLPYLASPYPEGESWADAISRAEAGVRDAVRRHDGQTIVVIGHAATRYGALRAAGDRRGLAELITAPFDWQPGWRHEVF